MQHFNRLYKIVLHGEIFVHEKFLQLFETQILVKIFERFSTITSEQLKTPFCELSPRD